MTPKRRERKVVNAEFGRYLVGRREERNWKQAAAATFAQRRGLKALTRQRLLRLERGQIKNFDEDLARALSTLYEVPYEDIVTRWMGKQLPIALAGGGSVSAGGDFAFVPVMPRRIAAGQPIVMDDQEEPVEYISFKQDFARRFKNAIAFRVGKGQQSMMPTLLPDDLVVVDRDPQRRLHPDPRNIYALNLDNGGTLKRVEVKSGLLIISSDNLNKTEYPTYAEPIAGRSLLDFIIGEVVWFGRYLGTGRGR